MACAALSMPGKASSEFTCHKLTQAQEWNKDQRHNAFSVIKLLQSGTKKIFKD